MADALTALEEQLRSTDASARAGWDQLAGPDPVAIAAVPGAGRERGFVGVLRGQSALVVLDPDGRERARAPAPARAEALAIGPDGVVVVAGPGELARYRAYIDDRGEGALTLLDRAAVIVDGAPVRTLRDIAMGPGGMIYAVDELTGRWLAVSPNLPERPTRTPRAGWPGRTLGRCRGPHQIRHVPGYVLVACLLDHALAVLPLDPSGGRATGAAAWIRHDGPIWSFDVVPGATPGELLIAAGGVEDHPLVRSDDGFGHIDSFVFSYRVSQVGAELAYQRLSEVNVSEHGVITPKQLALWSGAGPAVHLEVTGYGGERMARLSWPNGDLRAQPALTSLPAPPGIAAVATLAPSSATADRAAATDPTPQIAADPLLDAWVLLHRSPPEIIPAQSSKHEPIGRTAASRVGEALFFTTLLAPWNRADGAHSRFTCETCHFEGYGDGRVHYSGRGQVRVSTKPLRGLGNNRPYFSRAQDPTMAGMVYSEFRVANRGSGRDPWFSLSPSDHAWLPQIRELPDQLSPLYLRKALMRFLFDFTHQPNPARAGRTTWTPLERRGAERFRDLCEDCHRAQLVADEPNSRVAFEAWEAHVMSAPAAIVWADAVYVKTGIEPYVHEHGARVPSLRRLYKKWPYFTNGSADSLDQVLARAAWVGERFYHDGVPADSAAQPTTLNADDRRALRAFLALL
ncbi:hypothetical protein [Haliangium sp.]|uniref:hypothetical protein n=1 Tax=Haliangium sp. TaxID=2663208 RepID=UPI003D12C4CC